VNQQSTEPPSSRPLARAASERGPAGEVSAAGSDDTLSRDGSDGEFTPAPLLPRRQPGEPHPYTLERNPPNLWMLVFMTVGSLVAAAIVMVLTVLL
jgi:hypothetical protein